MARSMMNPTSSRKEAAGPGVPDVPKTCHKQSCKNDTDFVMAKVSGGKGIEFKPASDVMTWTVIHGTTVMTMNNNYQFVNWFSRCGLCLTNGMQRKKAKLREQGEHKNYV